LLCDVIQIYMVQLTSIPLIFFEVQDVGLPVKP